MDRLRVTVDAKRWTCSASMPGHMAGAFSGSAPVPGQPDLPLPPGPGPALSASKSDDRLRPAPKLPELSSAVEKLRARETACEESSGGDVQQSSMGTNDSCMVSASTWTLSSWPAGSHSGCAPGRKEVLNQV